MYHYLVNEIIVDQTQLIFLKDHIQTKVCDSQTSQKLHCGLFKSFESFKMHIYQAALVSWNLFVRPILSLWNLSSAPDFDSNSEAALSQ